LLRARHIAAGATLVVLAACGGGGSATGPTPTRTDSIAAFPGFDIANYPGDAAMAAWKYPASPYRWVGYYLAAPCHRDVSWTNKYQALAGMGWGIAALYVGQQDWTQIPSSAAAARADISEQLVTCSASLLTVQQGTDEASDAVTKMQSDGFPAHSVIFLDVENVQIVTPALLDYYRAWITGVLRDGRYRPGVYASKRNAPLLYGAAFDAFRLAGSSEIPYFWITASGSFSIALAPKAVGLDYAALWQGLYEAPQTWKAVTLTIDADVAYARSPSIP
jgi:hypothetical protein